MINNRIIRYSNRTIAQHLDRPFSTRFCTAFHSFRHRRRARNLVLRAQDIVLLNLRAAHHDDTFCARKGKVLHDRWVRDNLLQKVTAASAKNTTQKVCYAHTLPREKKKCVKKSLLRRSCMRVLSQFSAQPHFQEGGGTHYCDPLQKWQRQKRNESGKGCVCCTSSIITY